MSTSSRELNHCDEFRHDEFRPRPVEFLGVRTHGDGWRFKCYSIVYEAAAEPFDPERFEDVIPRALALLPEPAVTAGRPGVGFMLLHHGRGLDYLVLAWWDNENELPLALFVRPYGTERWRPSREGESVCVWDLEIIWHERQAYVRHVLTGKADLEAYLADAAGAA